MLFSPFRTRKPRQFDYHPRYYDPDKEAWEQRKQEVLGESEFMDDGKEAYKPGQYVREMRFRRGIIAERQRNTKKKPGVVRFAVFLALIFLMVWYLFFR